MVVGWYRAIILIHKKVESRLEEDRAIIPIHKKVESRLEEEAAVQCNDETTRAPFY